MIQTVQLRANHCVTPAQILIILIPSLFPFATAQQDSSDADACLVYSHMQFPFGQKGRLNGGRLNGGHRLTMCHLRHHVGAPQLFAPVP